MNWFDAVGQWFLGGLTSSNVITIVIALGALAVSVLAYRRGKPTPSQQPVLRPEVGPSAEAPWTMIVTKGDGTAVHVLRRTVVVQVLNAGPVPAHDVVLHSSGVVYERGHTWRLGIINPDEHPARQVAIVTSDDEEETREPRVWITWTEYPGEVARELDVPLD